MPKSQFKVPAISCGHCVNAIKNELVDLDGVTSVTGDPGTKTIEVEHDDTVSRESIKNLLKEINYPASGD